MATILSGVRQSGRDRPERQIEPSGAVWRTATLRAPDCLAGVQPARQPRALPGGSGDERGDYVGGMPV